MQKHPLTPTVLTDKSGVPTQASNPYLVFRRRTEKMQTRKVNINFLKFDIKLNSNLLFIKPTEPQERRAILRKDAHTKAGPDASSVSVQKKTLNKIKFLKY